MLWAFARMEIILYYTQRIPWVDVLVYGVQYIVFFVALWAVFFRPYMRMVRLRKREIADAVIKIERAESLIRDVKAKRAEILAGKR